jgi:hypothetical protein
MLPNRWQQTSPVPTRKSLGPTRTTTPGDFVADLRISGITPHVAQNTARPGGSAIDGRTVRHQGYAQSINARRGIEKVFDWIKQWWGGLGQSVQTERHRQGRCGVWSARDRLQPDPPGQSAPSRGDAGGMSGGLPSGVARRTTKTLNNSPNGPHPAV